LILLFPANPFYIRQILLPSGRQFVPREQFQDN